MAVNRAHRKSLKTAIFDGQVFQSAAWDRGMGKYSLCLLSSILADTRNGYDQCFLILSKNLSLSEEAEKALKNAAPNAELIYIDTKAPKNVPGEDIRPLQITNKRILNEFINSRGIDAPDFIILSLFIDQICSVFPDEAHKTLLFYDLIPLQYSERYGQSWSYPNYLNRFNVLFEADTILTISQTVADDIAIYTGISHKKLFNINGAPIARDHQEPVKPEGFSAERYVLMPSGNDLRKNNHRAVQGFEEYLRRSGDTQLKLVLTSYFDDGTKTSLMQISDNIIFVGNVSEAELRWLYEGAECLLFVSEYEGLGLPVLEAAEVDLPVVCSSLTVFGEMSATAFYYADEHNPVSIANALTSAINRRGFNEKVREYPLILNRYTWVNTANDALKAINSGRRSAGGTGVKPRLAVFTPNPAGYSAIGKVVMLTHSALSEYYDVDYYVEDARSAQRFKRVSFLHAVAQVYTANQFTAEKYSQYDAVIYHIGNSEYHLETINNALHLPGIMVVHDTNLRNAFEDELYRYGMIDPLRLEAERRLNDMSGTAKVSHMVSLLNAQMGVVTHSQYAKNALREVNYNEIPIHNANLPVGTPELARPREKDRPFRIGFGGIIHKAKGINLVEAISLADDIDGVEIHIFGIPLMDDASLAKLEAMPNVFIQKNLTDFEFEQTISDMDVVVSYRPNYNGETSLTVVEALRHGAIPIVRKVGWFDELPGDIVKKVTSEEQILDAIRSLLQNKPELSRRSQKSKLLTSTAYTYEQYADTLSSLIEAATKRKNDNVSLYNDLRVGMSKTDILKRMVQ